MALQVLSAQVNEEPPPLDEVSPAIAAVVQAALVKAPERRPGAREWALALGHAAFGEPA